MTDGRDPLGNTAGFVCVSGDPERKQRPVVKYRRQDQSKKHSSNHRHLACLHTIAPGSLPRVVVNQDSGRAQYGGLMTCGLVWECPVCAERIGRHRRQEMTRALQNWRQSGGSSFMVTFTVQHSRSDRLDLLYQDLSLGIRKLGALHSWKSLMQDLEVCGSIGASEVTYSLDNGWHPHKHKVFFSRLKPEDLDIPALEAQISGLFTREMAKLGHYVSGIYGVKVTWATDDYIAKWGIQGELTGGQVKDGAPGHFTPWQLLDLSSGGAKWAGMAWREYVQAMTGKKQLFWSRGLRDLLGVGAEVSDEDLAGSDPEEESRWVTVLWIDREQWRAVILTESRWRLLEIVEDQGAGAAISFLEALQKRVWKPPGSP